MLTVANESHALAYTNTYFGPAQVLETNKALRVVRLRLTGCLDERETWAGVATSFSHEFRKGQTVLAAGEDTNGMYVIGVLGEPADMPTGSGKLVSDNGVYAELTGPPQAETFKVISETQELIFEYDPASHKMRVNVSSGDIEFVSQGHIRFKSEKDIHFGGRRLKLDSQEIGVCARQGEFQIEDAQYTGKKYVARIDHVNLVCGKFESITKCVIQKADNIYQTIKGLAQLRTGRMRTFVDFTYHLKSKKSFLKSEEDFKINGDKIHLG